MLTFSEASLFTAIHSSQYKYSKDLNQRYLYGSSVKEVEGFVLEQNHAAEKILLYDISLRKHVTKLLFLFKR